MTGYVGVLPLVAATALLGRVRLRPRPPGWLVWHVIAVAGIVLALGGNTPVGSLLVHLPLFDSQRLQSRTAASPGSPGTGRREVAARHQSTWYFAEPLGVTRLEVPDADARQDAAQGTRIGLLTSGGTTRWFRAAAAGPARLAISLPRALTSVAVVAQAGGQSARLGPASVTDSDGRVFVADGQLQDALIPPRWGYAGRDGSFAVFEDHLASGPLRLQAIPGRPAPGASVRRVAGSAAAPAAAAVLSRMASGSSARSRPRPGGPPSGIPATAGPPP